MTPMKVRQILPEDRPDWLRMREALWPESLSDQPDPRVVTFVAEEPDGRLVGFLELDHRKYAPGCEASPVLFIEGWYVDPDARSRGVGRALVRAAEQWALAHGHHEIASDVEIDNAGAIAPHRALGYVEVERVVFFRRPLGDA